MFKHQSCTITLESLVTKLRACGGPGGISAATSMHREEDIGQDTSSLDELIVLHTFYWKKIE